MSEDEAVRLVPHDASWRGAFERERALLEGAIGRWLSGGIHHVGSTAVEGLPAKPVIDILAGVESLHPARACFAPLAELGYQYAPYRPEEMHWFCKPGPDRRTHHLHLVPTGSQRYRDELAFRDALRSDPALARKYAQLKYRLAAAHRHDREAYTEGKAAFVARALSAS